MHINFHVARLLVVAVTLFSTSLAFASDGQLEINQACADVGCFAGDAAGLPVSISKPGSYLLTGNLNVADANISAITISGDSVTLDLNGFALIGPVSCPGKPPVCSTTGSGTGVTISSPNATVRNGSIRGFGSFGISAFVNGLTIEALRVTECTSGGVRTSAQGGAFIGNHISHNGGHGINLAFGGPTSNTLRNNVIFNNAGDGVRTADGFFAGNTIFKNVGFGVHCGFGNATCSYVHNAFRDNNDGGSQYKSGVNLGGNLCGFDTTCP